MTTALHPVAVEDLVSDALDRLPDDLLTAIAAVPILVLDAGDAEDAHGRPNGDGLAPGLLPDRIVLYRDVLLRGFGDDRAVLTDLIELELRHQIVALGLH